MKKASLLAPVSAASLLASACTTQVATMPDLSRTGPAQALPGIPYNLPMLQYRIEATRTLTTCPTRLKIAGKTFVDPALSFDIKVSAKPSYVRGETYVVDYRSLSNILKQTSFGITTYETSGNLKTINLAADDKTGDVLKDVAAVGLQIAALSAGVPAPIIPAVQGIGGPANLVAVAEPTAEDYQALLKIAEDSSSEESFIDCTPLAQAALAASEMATKDLASKTALSKDASTELEHATSLTAVRGLSASAKSEYAKQLAGAFKKNDDAAKALDQAIKAKAKVVADIAQTQVRVWPEHLSDGPTKLAFSASDKAAFSVLLTPRPIKGLVLNPVKFGIALLDLRAKDSDQYARLAARHTILAGYIDLVEHMTEAKREEKIAHPKQSACRPGDTMLSSDACLAEMLTLNVRLDTVELNDGEFLDDPEKCGKHSATFPTLDCRKIAIPATVNDPKESAAKKAVVDARTTTVKGGIFVRQPIPGRLFVCSGSSCDPNNAPNLFAADPDKPPLIAPQLGQLRFLPFRNTTFQSNELNLELATDGSITKFEYKDKAAIAATASATAAAIAKQVDDYRTKQRKDAADAETQRVASLQAEIDILEKQKKLAALQTPISPDQTARDKAIKDLEAQTALLTAQLTRRKTYNDLVTAGGKVDPLEGP